MRISCILLDCPHLPAAPKNRIEAKPRYGRIFKKLPTNFSKPFVLAARRHRLAVVRVIGAGLLVDIEAVGALGLIDVPEVDVIPKLGVEDGPAEHGKPDDPEECRKDPFHGDEFADRAPVGHSLDRKSVV